MLNVTDEGEKRGGILTCDRASVQHQHKQVLDVRANVAGESVRRGVWQPRLSLSHLLHPVIVLIPRIAPTIDNTLFGCLPCFDTYRAQPSCSEDIVS